MKVEAPARKILFVEDDDKDAELILSSFKKSNILSSIERVSDGEKAISLLEERASTTDKKGLPGLVLLDLKLPKVSGLEVLKYIRGSEQLNWLPVVILTSSKEEKDLIESYKMNVNAYVVKPLDIHQFMMAVGEIGAFWAVLNELPETGRGGCDNGSL